MASDQQTALAFILISAFLCAPAGGGEISVVDGVTHVLNGAEPAAWTARKPDERFIYRGK